MTGVWEPVSCSEYEELRANPAMRVHSACTNYFGGEISAYRGGPILIESSRSLATVMDEVWTW